MRPRSKFRVKVTERFLVVFDGGLLGTLGKAKGRLAARVSNGAVRGESLFEHPQQHRHFSIHVVVDSHLCLIRVASMKPPCVLDEGTFPGDRHSQKESVQTGLVEALANVATRCHDETLVGIRNRGELSETLAPFHWRHPSLQYYKMSHERAESFGEVAKMVLALSQQDG